MKIKDPALSKTKVVVKLLFLIGATRIKSITKKKLEASIQAFIKDINEGKYNHD